jgi:hypothetical protein
VERLLPDQHRRDRGLEPLGPDPLHREANQGELQHDQVAEQVGEARARGAGRRLHLDPAVPLTELQVVERLEVELRVVPHLPHRDVVLLGLPLRGIRVREIRQRGKQLVALLAELRELGLELLELGLERAGCLTRLLELRVIRLAGASGLLDLPRQLVLLGADLVDPCIQLAPTLVGGKELIQLLRGTPSAQCRADLLGVATDLLQIERGWLPLGGCRRRCRCRRRLADDVLPRVLGDERGHLVRVGPDHDVLGHDRP